MNVRIEHDVVSLKAVVAEHVKGYRLKKGERIQSWQFFVDPAKDALIVKMFVESETPEG